MRAARVEDRLQRALEPGSAADGLIDVVLRFDLPPVGADAARMPLGQRRQSIADAMSKKIESALARAGEAAGEAPAQVSLFPAIGSAFVQAHPPYLRALLEQSDVAGATLNTPRSER